MLVTTRSGVRRAAALLILSIGLSISMVGELPGERSTASATTGTAQADLQRVDLVGLPAEYEELVEWALSRFDEAGLELPPLRITHHGDDREPCQGVGGFHRSRDGISVIDFCTTKVGMFAERLVLHELAHAWTDHQLTDARKSEFQDLRGWTHWVAHEDASWDELGCEQAAEIIAWGLSDRPIRSILIAQASCEDFEVGYRTLTGRPPPPGHPDRC